MSDSIYRLSKLFEKFPGIGPRQAGRFVQYLLRSSPALRRELAEAIRDLGGSVRCCNECFRFFAGERALCNICSNPQRDNALLAVVASDADLESLERSSTFHGRYFVLGGTLALTSEKIDGIRLANLIESLRARLEKGLEEIILALPANPEGDATADRVRHEIQQEFDAIKITTLGRGLSTGSELEYADADTLKNALFNRK